MPPCTFHGFGDPTASQPPKCPTWRSNSLPPLKTNNDIVQNPPKINRDFASNQICIGIFHVMLGFRTGKFRAAKSLRRTKYPRPSPKSPTSPDRFDSDFPLSENLSAVSNNGQLGDRFFKQGVPKEPFFHSGHIWMLPKIVGFPPQIINFKRVFHPFWGTPIFGNTHLDIPGCKMICFTNLNQASSHCFWRAACCLNYKLLTFITEGIYFLPIIWDLFCQSFGVLDVMFHIQPFLTRNKRRYLRCLWAVKR